MRRPPILLITLLLACVASAQQAVPSVASAPFQKWRAAILSGDSAALAALYSKTPEPQLVGTDNKPVALKDELAFWSFWKSQGLTDLSAQLVKEDDPKPGLHVLILQLTLTTKEGAALKKHYVAMAQGWFHADDKWSLGISQRSDATRLPQPLVRKDLYPANADANKEIAETLHSAAASHRRVLVVFGGNWCLDCHVLDEAFHSPEIAPTLDKSFLVVHVDIGQMDKNLDVAKKYDVPLDRGVPALAVLDSSGKLLFSQKRGEFEAARSMAPEDIIEFLNKWRPSPNQ
ncbi:MAG: thioredoxin family protein [Candidatus Acidiferrum sp.]